MTGCIAGALFVFLFEFMQKKLPKLDDVLGVWPLHGVCGLWGGIAAGIFGLQSLGGMGGVTFMSQLVGSLAGAGFAVVSGLVISGSVKAVGGIRLSQEDEFQGADLAIHKIGANSIEK